MKKVVEALCSSENEEDYYYYYYYYYYYCRSSSSSCSSSEIPCRCIMKLLPKIASVYLKLYKIFLEQVALNEMNSNETYNKVFIGKGLSHACPVQKDIKQILPLSSFLLNFVVEYPIKKVQESQKGLELNGAHQPLSYWLKHTYKK
jgi:hypothetical protein